MTATPPTSPASPTPATPDPTLAKIETDLATIADGAAAAVTVIAKVNVWTAIMGFFTALPGIIALIRSFMGWVNAVSGNNPQAFISDLGKSFDQLANAKTEADHAAAASSLAGIIGKLPS